MLLSLRHARIVGEAIELIVSAIVETRIGACFDRVGVPRSLSAFDLEN